MVTVTHAIIKELVEMVFSSGPMHLALQVGGVSDETVKYGHEFCGTSAQE
jgi:hypothetical protein